LIRRVHNILLVVSIRILNQKKMFYVGNTFSGSIILSKSNSNNANGIGSYSANMTETISIIKFFN
jgi:hypothetical protein